MRVKKNMDVFLPIPLRFFYFFFLVFCSSVEGEKSRRNADIVAAARPTAAN